MEIKCQLDATQVFIEDLIACSNKKKPIVDCWFLRTWCALGSGFSGWACLTHIREVADFTGQTEQATRSVIKTSVASCWHFILTYLW